METTNKPLTVAYADFKQELANLINNAGLPAMVVEALLTNYLHEISAIAQQQYQLDKTRYEQALADTKKE